MQVGSTYLFDFIQSIPQYLQHRMKKEARPNSSEKSKRQSTTLPMIQSQNSEWSPDKMLTKIKSKQAMQKKFHNIYSTEKSKLKSTLSRSRLEISYEQKYGWVHQQVDYSKLKDDQIRQENQKLRAALKKIDEQVDELMDTLSTKIEKNMSKIKIINTRNRSKTDASLLTLNPHDIQYRKQIQNREEANNEFILKLCKKEYIRLKKREKFIIGDEAPNQIQKANTAVMVIAHSRCKQRLQSSIEETINNISKTKEVNKKIKYKNKTIGNSIQATDEFIDNMKKLEFQVQFQQKTKIRIQRKLEKCQKSVTEIHKKLYQIKAQSDIAEQYLQKNYRKQKDQGQQKTKEQELKKKQKEKKLKDKQKELQSHSKQVIYHNLLVNLDEIKVSSKKIDDQINKVENENQSLKAEQKDLENKLQKMRMLRKSIANEAKIGLMLLSNGLLDENKQQMKSDCSIPLNQSKKLSKQPNKKLHNYLTGKIQKQKSDGVQIQTDPEDKKNSFKFRNDSQISSIKQNETKNSPIKNGRNMSGESQPL